MPPDPLASGSAAALASVQARVAAAAEEANRGADEIQIVAVSKSQIADRIESVLAAGHRVFGENRVQEAAAKWSSLRQRFPGVALHLVGPLQSNKAREAVALFDVIETVDRPRLARILAQEMEAAGRRPKCLVEVNLGEEPRKAGVAPSDLPSFLDLCRTELGLPVVGLMCIPPIDEEPAPYFALLAKLAVRHALPRVSMGMTADFETAVTFGATQVRVGTAIFGSRSPAHGNTVSD